MQTIKDALINLNLTASNEQIKWLKNIAKMYVFLLEITQNVRQKIKLLYFIYKPNLT